MQSEKYEQYLINNIHQKYKNLLSFLSKITLSPAKIFNGLFLCYVFHNKKSLQLEATLSVYGVFQNKVEAYGITTAHKSTSEFPITPTILRDFFLVKKAVIIPIIGSTTAIIIADLENRSSLKNHAPYTIKEIKKAATDMIPDFLMFIPL
ncbi:hypothetical protein J7E37_19270 [Bacillus sp. ISL-39]|nr:hypothetical protein [Bacillus sp. ISL-39]